jgi:tRNA (cytidine/uridine-2'-O-)-methyltransferase
VEPLGFRLTDRELKRAGLDYWESVNMVRHDDFKSFMSAFSPARLFFFSARGERSYLSVKYKAGDVFVFGGESRGLPDEILKVFADNLLTIPIRTKAVRSLNLATAVGIVLYEALRHVSADSNQA